MCVRRPLLSNPKISLLVFALNVLSADAIACRAFGSVGAAVTDGAPEVPAVRHEQGLGQQHSSYGVRGEGV